MIDKQEGEKERSCLEYTYRPAKNSIRCTLWPQPSLDVYAQLLAIELRRQAMYVRPISSAYALFRTSEKWPRASVIARFEGAKERPSFLLPFRARPSILRLQHARYCQLMKSFSLYPIFHLLICHSVSISSYLRT